MNSHYLGPQWLAPKKVRACVTTRKGGVSSEPYESMNLAYHVGDTTQSVAENRCRLKRELGFAYEPQWLDQVHGTKVVKAVAGGFPLKADAVYSNQPGLPCAVLTADCLPVFFCNLEGTQVAVAHAGWRGLADGVLEATLAVFEEPPNKVLAWLGPAIGATHFEVGIEVRERFLSHQVDMEQAFSESGNSGHWLADLYLLARMRLEHAGVIQITGGNYCTYAEPTRFYSYRREGLTGRMASLIWIEAE